MTETIDLIRVLRDAGRPLTDSEVCKAVGWKATLNPRSCMRNWLEDLIDVPESQGVPADVRVVEVVEDHKIKYTLEEINNRPNHLRHD